MDTVQVFAVKAAIQFCEDGNTEFAASPKGNRYYGL